MSELQTALIILGAIVVLALILLNRRGKSKPKSTAPVIPPLPPESPAPAPGTGFDEFGVSKARKRSGDPEPVVAPRAVLPEKVMPIASPKPAHTPAFVKPVEKGPAPKIIALYVAEREGTKINGAKIHAALEAQKLCYNEPNKAYDRLSDGRVQFSVTSLTAPGHLDRAQAAQFSTPGLGLFLKLPGPVAPKAALRDMLATAEALAAALKAVLFDAAQQPLTEDSVRRIAAELEDWARAAKS